MKLEKIAISNIYSFPYLNEKVLSHSFINLIGNNGICINIGANGSGKTNLLKVINYIFKYILIRHYKILPNYEQNLIDYIYHKREFEQYKEHLKEAGQRLRKKGDQTYRRKEENYFSAKDNLNNSIQPFFQKKYEIYKSDSNKNDQVIVCITLDNSDKNAIKTILDNREAIKNLALNYAKSSQLDDNYFILLEQLYKNFNLAKNLKIAVSLTKQKFLDTKLYAVSQKIKNKNFIINAAKAYLYNYNLVHALIYFNNQVIELNNKYNGLTKNKYIKPFSLKPNFLNLDIRRPEHILWKDNNNYGAVSINFHRYNEEMSMSFNESYVIEASDNDNEQYISVTLFDRCLNNIKEQILKDKKLYNNILCHPIVKRISSYSEKFANLKFIIKCDSNNDIYFSFIKNNNVISIETLSSGERVFVYFIILFCSNTLDKNTILLIDEPEIHMHPKMQKVFLDLLTEISVSMKLQIIIATHSPYFISNKNIKSINRFYTFQECFTRVVSSINTNSINDRDLMKVLETTNSSRVFFADKVILVEGVADEYVFRSYLSIYSKRNNIDMSNIDVLQINGKRNYKVWRDFLNKFKIDNYFIGDLDNVEEFLSNSSKQLLAEEKKFSPKVLILNITT